MRKRQLIFILGDIVIISVSFLFFVWIKPASLANYLPNHLSLFFYFLGIWLFLSMLLGKFSFVRRNIYILSLTPIVRSNLIILAALGILALATQKVQFSRMILFGTYGVSFTFEVFLTLFFFYNKRLTFDADKAYELNLDLEEKLKEGNGEKKENFEGYNILTEDPAVGRALDSLLAITIPEDRLNEIYEQNKKLVIREVGEEVFEFVSNHIDFKSLRNLIFSTTSSFNIEKQPFNDYESLINLHRINDVRRINKFFEAINIKLRKGGIFIGSVETIELRKGRIFSKLPAGISHIYYFLDFIYKRVMPKLFMTRKLYFFMNQGNNRVLSKQEVFGRLYSCGFKLISEQMINGLLYFAAKKTKEPVFDFNPSYGALFKMRRLGKEGKIIYVYKFRTMYPYSEYLQEYVYEKFKLADGGKILNDYRVTTLGKFMRKFWLDELPMLINFFRGDLKLVGVRPLSAHYFSLYCEELQTKRLKVKPGLIPPFYADLPVTMEEIQNSELKYLESYNKNPLFTDIKYFFIAFWNIVFRKARSK